MRQLAQLLSGYRPRSHTLSQTHTQWFLCKASATPCECFYRQQKHVDPPHRKKKLIVQSCGVCQSVNIQRKSTPNCYNHLTSESETFIVLFFLSDGFSYKLFLKILNKFQMTSWLKIGGEGPLSVCRCPEKPVLRRRRQARAFARGTAVVRSRVLFCFCYFNMERITKESRKCNQNVNA